MGQHFITSTENFSLDGRMDFVLVRENFVTMLIEPVDELTAFLHGQGEHFGFKLGDVHRKNLEWGWRLGNRFCQAADAFDCLRCGLRECVATGS